LVSLGAWEVDAAILVARSADEAVALALAD
jgi:hypothetical protein